MKQSRVRYKKWKQKDVRLLESPECLSVPCLTISLRACTCILDLVRAAEDVRCSVQSSSHEQCGSYELHWMRRTEDAVCSNASNGVSVGGTSCLELAREAESRTQVR